MAAFTLRVMATAFMLVTVSLRASRLIGTDALIIAVALGLALLASSAVFAGQLHAFAWLFTGHITSVLILQGSYGMLPLHPVRAYRRRRGH